MLSSFGSYFNSVSQPLLDSEPLLNTAKSSVHLSPSSTDRQYLNYGLLCSSQKRELPLLYMYKLLQGNLVDLPAWL